MGATLTFASETEFEEMREMMNKLREKIEKIMKINRELAETLIIIANLQEKILNILRDIRNEVGQHSIILQKHTQILEEHSRKLDEHTKILNKHTAILKKHTQILEEHSRKLDEHTKILDGHAEKLEDHSQMLQTLIKDVKDIKTMVRRFATDIEDEARESVPYYLREVLGKKIKLKRIEIKGVTEVNLYGITDDICVIGEVKTRIGLSAILDICSSLINLYEKAPNMLRKKIILVIYGLEITKIAEEYARKYEIGIITPRGILIKPKIRKLSEILEICNEIRRAL